MKGRGIIIALVIFVLTGAYIRGYRIITLEEVPNSHRPDAVILSADYAQQHLTRAE